MAPVQLFRTTVRHVHSIIASAVLKLLGVGSVPEALCHVPIGRMGKTSYARVRLANSRPQIHLFIAANTHRLKQMYVVCVLLYRCFQCGLLHDMSGSRRKKKHMCHAGLRPLPAHTIGPWHKTNTCTTQAFARYQHTEEISIHQIVNTRGGSSN